MAPERFPAAFLHAPGSTNDHEPGLFQVWAGAGPSAAGRRAVGLYHVAWKVDTLAELERLAHALQEHGALGGVSDLCTTNGLYGHDSDGLEFEMAWIVPAYLLNDAAKEVRSRIGRFDLEREKTRYGADSPGGIGISQPAPA